MRNITLTFEDGTTHQYNNVPDNVTPKQVHDRATQEFKGSKVVNIDGGKRGITAQSQPNPQDKGYIETLGGSLGKGVGDVALNVQNLVGQGLDKIGIDSAGKWLQEDAKKGHAKLASELQPYKDANPTTSAIGEVGGNVLATLPVGGILGKGVQAAGTALNTTKLAPLAEALVSSGMKATGAGMGTRIAGGAITGGASAGLVNPDDAVTGAVVGGALPVGIKALGAAGSAVGDLYNEGKRLIQPFYENGRANLLTENLINLLGDKSATVAKNLKNAKGYTKGFSPTAGQVGNSAELAAFERMFKNRNAGLFEDSIRDQTGALTNAANSLGGDDIARKALVDTRENTVKSLYDTAKQASVPIEDGLSSLLQRPALKQAISEAKVNAANRGEQIGTAAIEEMRPNIIGANGLPIVKEGAPATVTGKTLHEVKMALDAARNQTAVGGANKAQLGAIGDASNEFNQLLENAIPEYGQAKSTFANLSKPINQMDLGNAIRDKFIPAQYRDMDIPLSLNRATLAKIFEDNGDNLAKDITGFKGSTLNNTLSPEQFSILENLVKDNQAVLSGDNLGRGIGSPTYQHLAYNGKGEKLGLINSLLSLANKTPLGSTIGSVRDFAYKKPLEQLDIDMAKMLQDPNNTGNLIDQFLINQNKAPLINPEVARLLQQSTYKTVPVLTAQ